MPVINLNCIKSEKGAVSSLILISIIALVIFLLFSSFVPFKDKLFGFIYQKPVSEAKKADKEVKNIVSDNRFVFDFTNPSDAALWVSQVDPPYETYADPQHSRKIKVTPTTVGISNLKVENGYLKFKVLSNFAEIKGPRNLNIHIQDMRAGKLPQVKTGQFRIRAQSDGTGKIIKATNTTGEIGETGGIQVWMYYHDPDNEIDQDLWNIYTTPVYRNSQKPGVIMFDTFHDIGGWEKYPDDTNKFLGLNAYIQGYSIRLTNLKDQEIWVDYLGFIDNSYPDRGRADKDWGKIGVRAR